MKKKTKIKNCVDYIWEKVTATVMIVIDLSTGKYRATSTSKAIKSFEEGEIYNKLNTKGIRSLIIPDDCMPLERDDIEIEIIPSRDALRRRGLLPND